MLITSQELAILGLLPGDPLPTGGQTVQGTTLTCTGTSATWTNLFVEVFRRRWNVELQPGGLNVDLGGSFEWESPCLLIPGTSWEFIPVILNDNQAIGVSFRGNRLREDRLEIASPVKLRERLGIPVPNESAVSVRMLPGTYLEL